MKVNKIWRIIAVICLVLGITSFVGISYIRGKTDSVEQLDISIGQKNQTIVYDKENDILYIGSQGGLLAAYKDGEALWQTESVGGAINDIQLGAAGDRMYVGCENNHVYVYNIADGAQLQDIDTQRKVVGVSPSPDESKMAVITNTGSSKSNLMIYSASGEQLANTQYKSEVLRDIRYTESGDAVIVATNKGAIRNLSEDGTVNDSYKSGYEIKQMQYVNGIYWIVCRDGSYHAVTEDLKLVRTGKIVNTIGSIPCCIGVDAAGEYVLIGSEEGYIFVMNGNDEQIYTADFDVKLSDSAAADGMIYVTGYSDCIRVVYAENLANVNLFLKISDIFTVLAVVFIIGFVIAVIASIEKSRHASVKVLKKMWRDKIAYIMLIPTFVLLFFFSYRGIFTALIRAFTNWSVNNYYVAELEFVGLDNFRLILEEGYFLIGLKNMFLLIIVGVIKTLTVPLIAAWMLYSLKGNRRKYAYRFLFVLPIVVPSVVGALVWQKIYDPTIGLLNQVLGVMGLENLQRVWLGDSKVAFGSILAMGFPYISAMSLLVYYGGFLNIGDDVIESARIDGAGRWKLFWKIQLPLVGSQMELLLMLTFLGAIQEFNSIYIMTGGGPGSATYVPALELYMNISRFGRYGYASAMGIVLLVFSLTVTILSGIIKNRRKD